MGKSPITLKNSIVRDGGGYVYLPQIPRIKAGFRSAILSLELINKLCHRLHFLDRADTLA
jgi:hypothetical protein